MDQHPVRSALKNILWLAGFLGSLAFLGFLADMIVTDSRYLPVMTMAGQCLVALIFAEKLAQKVLRNRTPSPVILADWIGDSAAVITLVALLLARFTSTGVVYGVADAAVTDLPVVGVSA